MDDGDDDVMLKFGMVLVELSQEDGGAYARGWWMLMMKAELTQEDGGAK